MVSIYTLEHTFWTTRVHEHAQTHDWEGCPKLETVQQLFADGFAQDTELVTLQGLLIAGPRWPTGCSAVDPAIIFSILKLHSSCRVWTGLFTSAQNHQECVICANREFDMLTFSFSQLLPRRLPWHSLQFHSTSFNFVTARGGLGARRAPPLPPLCSSLVCKSRGKFGSVISGWSEPVFVGIILHRRLGLKP